MFHLIVTTQQCKFSGSRHPISHHINRIHYIYLTTRMGKRSLLRNRQLIFNVMEVIQQLCFRRCVIPLNQVVSTTPCVAVSHKGTIVYQNKCNTFANRDGLWSPFDAASPIIVSHGALRIAPH